MLAGARMDRGAVVLGVGVLLVVVAILMFAFGKGGRGRNRIKAFGVETEVSTPSLVFLVFGVILILAPLLSPSSVATDKSSGKVQENSIGPGSTEPKGQAAADLRAVRDRNAARRERAFGGRSLNVAAREHGDDPTVACALRELDRRVAERPPGSNKGPRINVYYRVLEAQPDGGDWAGAFVSYCLVDSGVEGALAPSASVDELYRRASRSSAFRKAGGNGDPEPGSILFIKNRFGYHTGIVANSDSAEGLAIMIGGNQSHAVTAMLVDYSTSREVLGWLSML